mmetsp:Transcript_29187/g.65359  ORF Transcript_29187/g.65359 Transcript_29187/m.65359 type:complete len:206 (-) Transcript_29187:202-819(-)
MQGDDSGVLAVARLADVHRAPDLARCLGGFGGPLQRPRRRWRGESNGRDGTAAAKRRHCIARKGRGGVFAPAFERGDSRMRVGRLLGARSLEQHPQVAAWGQNPPERVRRKRWGNRSNGLARSGVPRTRSLHRTRRPPRPRSPGCLRDEEVGRGRGTSRGGSPDCLPISRGEAKEERGRLFQLGDPASRRILRVTARHRMPRREN